MNKDILQWGRVKDVGRFFLILVITGMAWYVAYVGAQLAMSDKLTVEFVGLATAIVGPWAYIVKEHFTKSVNYGLNVSPTIVSANLTK